MARYRGEKLGKEELDPEEKAKKDAKAAAEAAKKQAEADKAAGIAPKEGGDKKKK